MLGTYFYHEIFRKTVIAFGTIFNDIEIRHANSSNNTTSIIKVPLAYAPIQKFLARIEQQPDIESKKGITLPRMSFELTSFNYDNSRKLTVTKEFKAIDKTNNREVKKVFMPVPYNVGFELNIMTKLNEDALQIIEQILPYFQPAYNITVNLIDGINEKKDIPVVLEGISIRDDYEGNYDTRRVLIYTLRFNVKTYLYGPVPTTSTPGIIKKVQVDLHTDTAPYTPRSFRYTATPTATKNYTGNSLTTLSNSIDESITSIDLNDASSLSVGSRIYVNEELLKVQQITGNSLKVIRGYEGTTPSSHVSGESIYLVDSSDDLLIESGDDFGFSGSSSFFDDGKIYNPDSGTDIDPSLLQ
jgi:hypothetical protein